MDDEFASREPADASGALAADLRDRLRFAVAQESAARKVLRQLDTEVSIARRLLKFFSGTGEFAAQRTESPTDSGPVLVSAPLVYHLDRCEHDGARTEIMGWAFRPVSGWDARKTEITVVLRHDDTIYSVACQRVNRTDVAAHFARQPAAAGGGANGIEGAGFHCQFADGTLPAGNEWKVALRLECAAGACEQFTGTTIRL